MYVRTSCDMKCLSVQPAHQGNKATVEVVRTYVGAASLSLDFPRGFRLVLYMVSML